MAETSRELYGDDIGSIPIQRTLPDGLDGTYHDPFTGDDEADGDDGSGGSGETTSLLPPTNIIVKSQTIRFTPEGVQVVDVVLEWDEAAGATNYQVMVSKV